ncbi:MAG TPA: NosD domain-containing protein [Solirubrobacterales bacterium]|nr:NosD domain-containing protein [Solirubrobacterales bacterium]
MAVVAGLAAPTAAHADIDNLLVDTDSDDPALDACNAAPADCSLPGAFIETSDDAGGPDVDRIDFDPAIFDGQGGNSTIQLSSPITSLEPLDLGLNCALERPCVGIEGPPIGYAVGLGNGPVRVSGLAIFDSPTGLLTDTTTDGLELSNSWLGLRLNGNAAGNGNGLFVNGSNLQIGGVGLKPNVFAGNKVGVRVFGADNVTVQGNLFGVKANADLEANTEADVRINDNGGFQTESILIGAEPDATPECDGACNVMVAAAGASGQGIDLAEDIDGNPAATDVQVIGNHIGVRAGGDTPIGDSGELVRVGTADEVTIARNRLAGGVLGITSDPGSSNLLVEENAIGLNAAEDALITSPTSGAIAVDSTAVTPAVVSGNRIGSTTGGGSITSAGEGAVVTGNTVGLPGVAGSGGDTAINVFSTDTEVTENVVTEAEEGISFHASNGTITQNSISNVTDEGITLTDTASTIIGGEDAEDANIIENAGDDAIRISGSSSPRVARGGTMSVGNTVGVNLGEGAGQFLDLQGLDGPGNGPTGANSGIEAPKLKKAERKQLKGKGVPKARIAIYKTKSPKGEVPTGLKKFLGTAKVKGDGKWEFEPQKKLNKGQIVTALQTDKEGNSSELTEGKKVKD